MILFNAATPAKCSNQCRHYPPLSAISCHYPPSPTSLKDPYGVLGVAYLEKAVCQKCGHELAYDLNKFTNGIFDESSIYCPPYRRSTVQLVPCTCEESRMWLCFRLWWRVLLLSPVRERGKWPLPIGRTDQGSPVWSSLAFLLQDHLHSWGGALEWIGWCLQVVGGNPTSHEAW